MKEELIRKAVEFSSAKHTGQKRNDGRDYITHPMRVSAMVNTELERVCALLHDTVEDTGTTLAEIEENFGEEVRIIVDCLTHRKGESYDDYITRVLTNPTARRVKIADICDNLNDAPSKNMVEKAVKALPRLLL